MKKVFIGLLTFSLGAYIALSFVNVFAFTNPSANPPGGNVAPVFSSININNGGLIMDNDASTVNGRFRANFDPTTTTTTIGGSNFTIDSVSTTFANNVGFSAGVATNTITPLGGINSAPIRIRGATSVENNLDVWNDISNSSTNSAGAVSINDALNVTGNISNSGGDVNINDTLNLSGNLYNAIGDLTIDDKAILKGNVDIWGTLAAPDASLDINSSVYVNGAISTNGVATSDLNVTNFITNTSNNKLRLEDDSGIDINLLGENPVTINGTGDAIGSFPSGILNIRNGARGVVFDQNEIMSIGGALYINDEGGQNVVIGNNAAPSNLTVYGNITSSIGIGRFYSIESSTAVPVNVTDSAVAVCDVGDLRIACSGSTSNTTGISFHGAWISGERTCNARLKNGNTAAATVYTRAYCFSPNG